MSDYLSQQVHSKHKKPDYTIVHVKWLDSFSLDDTWVNSDQIPTHGYEVHTVRFFNS